MTVRTKLKQKQDSKLHVKILRSILIGLGLYISLNVYMTILLMGLLAYSIGDMIFASRGLMPKKSLGLSRGFKALFVSNLLVISIPLPSCLWFFDSDPICAFMGLIGCLGISLGLSFLLIRHFMDDAMKLQNYVEKVFQVWLNETFSD